MMQNYYTIKAIRTQVLSSIFDKPVPINFIKHLYHTALLTQQHGYCFAHDKYFAEKLNVSVRTVKRYNALAVKHGLISRLNRSRSFRKTDVCEKLKEIIFEEPQKPVRKPSPQRDPASTSEYTNVPSDVPSDVPSIYNNIVINNNTYPLPPKGVSASTEAPVGAYKKKFSSYPKGTRLLFFQVMIWNNTKIKECFKEERLKKVAFRNFCRCIRKGKSIEAIKERAETYYTSMQSKNPQYVKRLNNFLHPDTGYVMHDWEDRIRRPKDDIPLAFKHKPKEWAKEFLRRNLCPHDLAEVHTKRDDWTFASYAFRKYVKNAVDAGYDWDFNGYRWFLVSKEEREEQERRKAAKESALKQEAERMRKWFSEYKKLYPLELLEREMACRDFYAHVADNSFFYQDVKAYLNAFESGKTAKDYINDTAEPLKTNA